MAEQTWSLDTVTCIEDLSPDPLVYERPEFMEHIRRYDREDLRAFYQRQLTTAIKRARFLALIPYSDQHRV